MRDNFCSYLGTRGKDDRRGPAQEYPSFENCCFATALVDPFADGLESDDQLLLIDQATYCLGQGHQLCPRYRLTAHTASPLYTVDADAPYGEPSALDDFIAEDDYAEGGPRPGFWIGLASLFLLFLLCGGSVAAYTGWQLVGRGVISLGRPLAENTPPPEQIFLLVTPTSAALSLISPAATPTNTPTFAFPKAVTPTPTEEPPPPGAVVITTPTPKEPGADGSAPADPSLATAVAGAVIITTPGGILAPTRRPTPEVIIPTSTPGEPQVIVVTATPTPGFPEPVVDFRSAHQSLPPESCTTLDREVEHVRAVFLDNQGVNGKGEKRVCLLNATGTFMLSVLNLDGSEKSYPVTVQVIPYSPTPTLTPTPTPVLTPTPTWTPNGSAATPAGEPPRQGVQLSVDGGNQQQCTVGQLCQVVLQVNNIGNLADEIFIDMAKQGPWGVVICRPDNSCGETSISVGIGPGGQIPVTLRATIPGDAQGQSYTFQIIGASGNSNRTVRSAPALVTLTVQ